MRSVKILIGVLAEFEQHFLKHLGLPLDHATSWDDPRFKDNFHRVKDDYDFWLSMPRIFDPKLLKFKPVCYVTARPIPNELSIEWLKRNGFPVEEVVTVGHNGSKVEPLKRIGVDLFLDDAHHNYIELNNNHVNCLLVTRPHNTSFEVWYDRVESVLDFQKQFIEKCN